MTDKQALEAAALFMFIKGGNPEVIKRLEEMAAVLPDTKSQPTPQADSLNVAVDEQGCAYRSKPDSDGKDLTDA